MAQGGSLPLVVLALSLLGCGDASEIRRAGPPAGGNVSPVTGKRPLGQKIVPDYEHPMFTGVEQ